MLNKYIALLSCRRLLLSVDV